jgi:3-deoxy-D-manno-octulosonate 8-phosphate phosphatase (KDO 8-P phosphatase)
MNKPVFIMDLDGVLTDGCFLYDANGKAYKTFGPDDADALKLIKDKVELVFVSADHRGFPISSKRINDMGYELTNVKSSERLEWIKSRWDLQDVIYMGDSFVDIPIFQHVGVSIIPKDGFWFAKKFATYETKHEGGKRAVAEAVFWIAKNILGINEFDLLGIEHKYHIGKDDK